MGQKPAFPAGNSAIDPTGFVKLDSMDEHRIASRHRVLKAGTIEFGGGAIDCTVRNMSATGAALGVTSPLGIPAQFTLVTDGNHLPCRVVWRKEKRIGVTFDQKP
jgi:PilZ domain